MTKQKLYPTAFPRKGCPLCGKMARITGWTPIGYDPMLRQFICKFGHFHYRILTEWELEVERYLRVGVWYK